PQRTTRLKSFIRHARESRYPVCDSGPPLFARVTTASSLRRREFLGFDLALGLGGRADPRMFRAIENNPVRSPEFRLEKDAAHARIGPHEARRAHFLELLDIAVEIVDQHAEMMDADIVEPFAELIDILEFEYGEVQRAVAEIDAPGDAARIIWIAGAADLLEVESPLIELGGLDRIVGRERDMANLGHGPALPGAVLCQGVAW